MRSYEVVTKDMNRLADEAQRLVADRTKSVGQKRGALDRLEPKIKALKDELAQAHAYEVAEAKIPGGYLGLSDTHPEGTLLGAGGVVLGYSTPSPNRSTMSTSSIIDNDLPPARKAWGEAVVKAGVSDGYEFKSLLPSGAITVPSVSAGITRIPDRPLTILELVPTVALEGTDTFSYLKESARNLAASPVAVGAQKPTSTLSLVKVDSHVVTIATLSEAIPRQWLSDAALLQGYVSGSLFAAVQQALEDQVVNGTGAGEDLDGITQTTTTPVAFSTDPIETARKTLTSMELLHLVPSVFLLSPSDWEAIEMSVQSTAGAYVLGPNTLPVDRAAKRLWGTRVVTSTALDDGLGYAVDVGGSTRLWSREGTTLSWSENMWNADTEANDFARNLIRFRAEGRWGFARLRDAGITPFETAA